MNAEIKVCAVKLLAAFFVALLATGAVARPAPRPALLKRMVEGPEIIGIVHWGPNTYIDKEWGYGDADPELLAPTRFDADQIVGAAKAGGIGGLVVVAKHHDGFCLWPTKTTPYNIRRSPFWRSGKGEEGRDYVKEMEQACRRAGLKFGVYVSPWDRHDADYASAAYVEKYHGQIRELTGGTYGEIFELWFDGANGGDGYYGGAREKRKIARNYYRFGEVLRFVKEHNPSVTVFGGGRDGDFRWPGNERGLIDPDSRATCKGLGRRPDELTFKPFEADFPLRRGWFWHAREKGTTKGAVHLTKLYLSSVGNGGTMNIGLAPNKEGLIDDADVKALSGFAAMRRALFAREAKDGEPFNVVVLQENLSGGERVDAWELVADGKTVLTGTVIGVKRIRTLESPLSAATCRVNVLKSAGEPQVSMRRYLADPKMVKSLLYQKPKSEETDTAKWMKAAARDNGRDKKGKPLKVLMIGNSFSRCNLGEMPHVAAAMGRRLDLASLFIGGCSLARHWTNVVVASTNATARMYRFDRTLDGRKTVVDGRINIQEALALDTWDVVTLQQASHLSWKPESYEPFAGLLVAKIRALAPRAKILLHETWSYPPWDKRLAKFGFDQKEMYARLHAAYGAMAAKYGFDVIPVGTAAEYIPNREALFKKGDSHFGREGVYLQGLTFTATLYGVDVGKCPYRPKWMSPSRAEEMKSAVLSAGAANLPARLPPTGAPAKK